MTVNRNKKSVVLDLKANRDLEVAQELAFLSDVLIHNMRPGVMDRLGLGYETLQITNPKLIYTSISGFGESGSYPVTQARS
ncbi:coA-transferase III family protein [Paraburkholderia xenovorans LB400]|nr:coA-transferase III family protein [Paraburkholderia xenovorans LB400]